MALDAAGAAADIAAMRVRGATRLATLAAQALAAEASRAPGSLADVQRAARRAHDLLKAARPTSVALENALARVLHPVLAAATAEQARAGGPQAADALVRDLAESRASIARTGARVLPDDGWVLTHCNSDAVLAVLAAGRAAGKRFSVLATETRPGRQGLLTARALAEANIPCTLLVDAAVERALEEFGVRLALVGADTVASDGSLFNKVGTSAVAVLCRQRGVPFHSAASFLKFTRRAPAAIVVEERAASEFAPPEAVPPGVRIYNPVFDRTPAALVSSYLTESGSVPPAQAVANALGRLPEVAA